MVYGQAIAYVAGKNSKKGGRMAKKAEQESRLGRNQRRTASLGDQGGDWADIMRRQTEGFEGDPNFLVEYMRENAPLLLSQLLKTDAAKDISDVGRMTDLAYQPAAQQMERSTQGAIESTRGAMALSGMGQGTAMPALESTMRMSAAGHRGNMYQQMLLQNLQSRYNMQQNVAAMGAGFAPQPIAQQGGGGTDWAAIAGVAGQAAGAYFGSQGGGGGGQQAPPQQTGGYNGKPYW